MSWPRPYEHSLLAYNLGNLLHRLALPVTIQSWSLTSLLQRLFKTGGVSCDMPGTSGSNWPGGT